MPPHVDKVILSDDRKLLAKYGPAGRTAVHQAVARLVAADAARGIGARYLALDDAAAMTALGLAAVPAGAGEADYKRAVDDVYRALVPDYILLLGSHDVIPHQTLTNPAYAPGSDDDAGVPSDLPYASNAPHGTNPADFVAATRVVGRLPNVTGDTAPAYLVSLVDAAAAAAPRPASAFKTVLGITAQVWLGSTNLSLAAAFGSSAGIKVSPADGPTWTAAELGRRSHFINCHGAAGDPHFYGQGTAGGFPISHDAAHLAVNALAGDVVAAECCYGVELYDPTAVGVRMGIANTYLDRGASGFFGSTNIAYGPASSTGWADLICQYFFTHLLAGSSLGLAVLQARQDYVAANSPLDPYDVKTLAQFLLLGDPSFHPVAALQPHAGMLAEANVLLPANAETSERAARRRQLTRRGTELGRTTPISESTPSGLTTPQAAAPLEAVAARLGLENTEVRRFRIQAPPNDAGAAIHAVTPDAAAFHVLTGRQRAAGENADRIVRTAIVVGKEIGGDVTSVRVGFAR